MEEKLENKIEPKELWRVFGIFIAVITFFFLVIVSLVMISRNPYEKNLQTRFRLFLMNIILINGLSEKKSI